MLYIGLVLRLSIDVEDLISHLEGVTWGTDEPLDIILPWVMWWNEDDDVTPLWLCEARQSLRGTGELSAIDRLVHEEEVTDEEGLLHTPGRDTKGLYQKGPYEEEEDQGHHDGLGHFPGGLPPLGSILSSVLLSPGPSGPVLSRLSSLATHRYSLIRSLAPLEAPHGGTKTSIELPLPPLGRSGSAVIPIRRTFCGLLPSQSRDQEFISHAVFGSGWPLPGRAPPRRHTGRTEHLSGVTPPASRAIRESSHTNPQDVLRSPPLPKPRSRLHLSCHLGIGVAAPRWGPPPGPADQLNSCRSGISANDQSNLHI